MAQSRFPFYRQFSGLGEQFGMRSEKGRPKAASSWFRSLSFD
jgi:hypothetical protein